jgi:hypothetical protein
MANKITKKEKDAIAHLKKLIEDTISSNPDLAHLSLSEFRLTDNVNAPSAKGVKICIDPKTGERYYYTGSNGCPK